MVAPVLSRWVPSSTPCRVVDSQVDGRRARQGEQAAPLVDIRSSRLVAQVVGDLIAVDDHTPTAVVLVGIHQPEPEIIEIEAIFEIPVLVEFGGVRVHIHLLDADRNFPGTFYFCFFLGLGNHGRQQEQ